MAGKHYGYVRLPHVPGCWVCDSQREMSTADRARRGVRERKERLAALNG